MMNMVNIIAQHQHVTNVLVSNVSRLMVAFSSKHHHVSYVQLIEPLIWLFVLFILTWTVMVWVFSFRLVLVSIFGRKYNWLFLCHSPAQYQCYSRPERLLLRSLYSSVLPTPLCTVNYSCR